MTKASSLREVLSTDRRAVCRSNGKKNFLAQKCFHSFFLIILSFRGELARCTGLSPSFCSNWRMHSAFLVAIVRRRAAMTVVSVSTSSKMTSTAAALRRPLPMPSPPRSFLHPSCSSLGTFSSFARHSSGVDSLHSVPSRPGRCTSASALKGKARDSSPSKSPLKSSSPSPLSSSLPALTPDNFPEHVPVLLAEVLKSFACLEEISLYVDGTLGAGGHAAALVRSLAKEKKLKAVVGLDVDARARELASAALSEAAAEVSTAASCPPPVMRVLDANFRDIEEALESVSEELVSEGVFRSPSPPTSSPPTSSASSASKKTRPRLKASAILLDLGVSSMQLGNAERGFSFAADGPLDMRLDGGGGGGKASRDSEDFTSKSSGPVTAATIVNTWPEADLASLFAAREYGGERHAKLAARRIVKAREESEGEQFFNFLIFF